MLNRFQIKAEAKQIVRTAHLSPLLITAIVLVVNFVLSRVIDLVEHGSLFYSSAFLAQYYEAIMSGDPAALERLLFSADPAGTVMSGFFSILVSLFTTVLMGGYYVYSIGIRRGMVMPATSLLDGLGHAGRLILCYIIMSVKIALWSMLFVVPGIIAAYRYRFAYYNLLTDDSLTANQAIKLSCAQTRGMKMDLFVLDLSFLGWNIVSALTMGILDIWVMPYQTQCDLAYFEEGQRRVGRPPYQDDGYQNDGYQQY